MQRFRRAALMGPLAVVLIVTPLLAQESFDGTYSGTVTRFSRDPASIISIEDDAVTVTVTGPAIEGRERFVVLIDGNPDGFVQVTERVSQWAEFSGTINPDGTFEAPGLSFSSFEIVSCEGSDELCSTWPVARGESDGYPINVTGTISEGTMRAEIIWDATDPQFAFEATNPAYAEGGTTPAEPEYGVVVRGDLIFITSPPGETLEIESADLPPWARGLLATVGDTYARVGPPGTISGGDPAVLLDGIPVARVGDPTTMGGTIVEGSALIFINGVPAATVGSMVIDPMVTGFVPGIGGPIMGTGACRDFTIDWLGSVVCVADQGRPLQEAVKQGDMRLNLTDNGEFEIGDGLMIGDDEQTIETAVVADKGSLILDRPLQYDHPAGAGVVRIPAEYVDQVIAAPGAEPETSDDDGPSPVVIAALAAALLLAVWAVTTRRQRPSSPADAIDRMIPSEQAEGTPMNDQQPQPPESDADVVLSALKNMGSSDYATLAIATGLSKPAISSAITELSKQGLVTGKSGTYSPTDAAAKKPTNAKAATAEKPPPPPPPPPPAEAKKPKPAAKPAATDSGADSDVVLAALKKMGSGTYATLAEATGLSKPAVSSAITDLSKQGLVTGKAGEYTITGATPKTAAAKAPQQDSTPSPAPQSAASLANELEKLAALRDSGALTAAEFTKAKKKLLELD